MTKDDRVVIRTASVHDLSAMAAVYISSAQHHAALDPELYAVPDPGDVAKELGAALDQTDRDKTVRLVAEVDGTVVGSASVELRLPSPGSMFRPMLAAWVGVAVLEDRRGAGIGSRLMEAAERWARERGADMMMLDASAANPEALRFYERRHGYRRSGILMRKPIPLRARARGRREQG